MDIYLGLGSNLGDRRRNLIRALESLPAHGVTVQRVSPVVESPAMLPDDAPADWNQPFLNIVASCSTERSPHDVLAGLKAIERELGRAARGRWAPREIDLDILLWGRETIATSELTVPHAGLTQRAFVLSPLAALAPQLTIPGHGSRTVLEHARASRLSLPIWMGIVNLTPDSFSDGGELAADADVDARIDQLHADGAEIVDLGGESTRPGATPLTADDEWLRLEPALGRLMDRYRGRPLRPHVSIDTYHAATAKRALGLGVDIVNDVSGLTSEAMLEVAAMSGKDFVAMHNLGVPADKARILPVDADPTAALERWVDERLTEWQRSGLDLNRIVFDPGIGFGKNALQSQRILRDIERFHGCGLRILVGHSRKSFMHHVTAADRAERDLFTVGASLSLSARSVDILRVHNVLAHVAAYRGWSHLT